MRHVRILVASLVLLAPVGAAADRVVPTERVKSRVVVRSDPGTRARPVGSLRPGEAAVWLESLGDWHRVRLADATEGFVSQAWTRRVAEPGEPRRESRGARLRRALGDAFEGAASLLGAAPGVVFSFRGPARDGAVHVHDDPRLPVAGFATAAGGKGTYDLVLALDASTSTREFAGMDVDGDGRVRDVWDGPDSIFRAQVKAARELVAALSRLPGNRKGERIRVGVVTFAGDERHAGQGASFVATPEAVLELARRDAKLRIRPTGDYRALDRGLRRLEGLKPKGATDFAAGIGAALVGLEVLGPPASGGPHGARPDAEKVIFFLTDGKPRLPGDRETAEEAARYAARLAGSAGVRIHAFALGQDAVARGKDPTLKDMARRSRGRWVAMQDPGEVVGLLRTASFAFVERVKIRNLTRGEESAFIATAIDGSFFGEIELAEGDNEIEVVAVMNDAREATERFTVSYQDAAPRREQARRLAELREENEALIEQIRRNLVQEMEQVRAGQRRSVTLSAEPLPAEQAPR